MAPGKDAQEQGRISSEASPLLDSHTSAGGIDRQDSLRRHGMIFLGMDAEGIMPATRNACERLIQIPLNLLRAFQMRALCIELCPS